MSAALPAKRLSAFYLFWFASLGALLPYWGLYLQDAGHSASRIGAVFAVLMGTKMIAPNVWGWLVDHYGGRVALIRMATGVAAVVFVCMPFVDSYLAIALLMVGYGFFSNAALPQFEAVTFNHLGAREQEYGRIRLWGSVGFIVSVTALGPILDQVGTWPVPWWIVACLCGLFLVSLSVPDAREPLSSEGEQGLWQVLRRPEVASLLVVCFLAQFSHGPYYSFFSIYMEQHDYKRGLIGMLWAVGVLAEIAVFAFLPALERRYGLRRLMLAALAVTAMRWALLAAFAQYLWLLWPIQIMHMASFGLYHAVAVSLIHRLFRGKLQGRGQALYSSLSFGAGGAVGSLASGYIWEAAPGHAIFVMASAAGGLAFLIAWLGLRGYPVESRPAMAGG